MAFIHCHLVNLKTTVLIWITFHIEDVCKYLIFTHVHLFVHFDVTQFKRLTTWDILI
jgi:hypothetical protein